MMNSQMNKIELLEEGDLGQEKLPKMRLYVTEGGE